jgi:hypothetical protein
MRDRFGTEIAPCTRSIFRNELLIKTVRRALPDQARQHVSCSAGRRADNQPHRARRGLRPCDSRK